VDEGAAQGSFTLTLDRPSVALSAGNGASVQIALAGKGGFTGPVTLSLSAPIPGVRAQFFPSTPVTVPGQATLSLSADATAAAAEAALSVKGAGHGAQASVPLSVRVQAAPVVSTFTETEANDTRSTANVVPPGATALVGYFPAASDNDDWYKVTLAAGRTLAAAMTGPTASSQDYDLYLTNSTGTVLAASEQEGTTEALSYRNTGATARTLYLKVHRYASYSRTTPYTITLSR
jgi:hypothetical protein